MRIDIVLQSPSKVVNPTTGVPFEFQVVAKHYESGALAILATVDGLQPAALLVAAYDSVLNGNRRGWTGDRFETL